MIFGLLNFKNVEIHILGLTWQRIGDRSNQFKVLRENKNNFNLRKSEN